MSQISNLTVVFSSREMVWVRKAAPMVDSLNESNWSWVAGQHRAHRSIVGHHTLTNRRTIELCSMYTVSKSITGLRLAENVHLSDSRLSCWHMLAGDDADDETQIRTYRAERA